MYVLNPEGDLKGVVTLRDIISTFVEEPFGYFKDFFAGVVPATAFAWGFWNLVHLHFYIAYVCTGIFDMWFLMILQTNMASHLIHKQAMETHQMY